MRDNAKNYSTSKYYNTCWPPQWSVSRCPRSSDPANMGMITVFDTWCKRIKSNVGLGPGAIKLSFDWCKIEWIGMNLRALMPSQCWSLCLEVIKSS